MSTRRHSGTAAHEQTNDEVERAAAHRNQRYIKAMAHRLSDGDRELAKDLEQEALIVPWTEDPTRFDAGDEWYLRGAMRKRMLASVRKEHRLSLRGRRLDLYMDWRADGGAVRAAPG